MSEPPKPRTRRPPSQRAPKDSRASQPAPRGNPKAVDRDQALLSNPRVKPRVSKKPPVPPNTRAGKKKSRGPRPPRKDSTKLSTPKFLAIVVALLFSMLATGFGAFVLSPGPGDGAAVELDWKPPLSAGDAAQLLADAGLVGSPWLMSLYLRIDGHWREVDVGTHLLGTDMSPRTLVRRLRRVPGGAEVKVVIPEGFDKFDVARRLREGGVASGRAFLAATTDAALLSELRISARDAEGYLFPATYSFPRNHAPAAILRRLVNESTKRHARVFDEHASAFGKLQKDLGWTRHSVLVLASMVEKEAAVDEERPLVASVFLNRMYSETFRPKQRLQSDPTARYGCLLDPSSTPTCIGAEKGVTGPMVRDPLNPYSTYAHSGLPPGPICNPGERSLQAVLAPAKTKYLYFVATGGGRHKFSETYEDHLGAIRRGQDKR